MEEEQRLKSGKCYKSENCVVRVLCGAVISTSLIELRGKEQHVWLIESKVKPKSEATSMWELRWIEQDKTYMVELISQKEWDKF